MNNTRSKRMLQLAMLSDNDNCVKGTTERKECGSDEYNFREGDEDPWTEFKKWKREGEKNWNKEISWKPNENEEVSSTCTSYISSEIPYIPRFGFKETYDMQELSTLENEYNEVLPVYEEQNITNEINTSAANTNKITVLQNITLPWKLSEDAFSTCKSNSEIHDTQPFQHEGQFNVQEVSENLQTASKEILLIYEKQNIGNEIRSEVNTKENTVLQNITVRVSNSSNK
ncbi:uncharacterized protein LOC108916738 [Anoplophora glabripennis]|uniref:uncharacterized protein LOC108916738 n=1 Tax=Anoplophora glabripennis TaxID=217634 RepID=UPI0008734DF0|nr:uncharacterized protein LOC108916738 [Anoplophora glabripennis]